MVFIVSSTYALTAFICTLISIHTASGAATFTEIDITKVPGTGLAAKAAADRLCGPDLSVEILTRRHALANTAELTFFNPRIIASLKLDDAVLNKALNCQKIRNKVLKDTCELQASKKLNLKCETDKNTKEVADNIDAATKACTGANETLFVTVTGINDPSPPEPKDVCGADVKPSSATKYADMDITKSASTGDAARTDAERFCGASLSVDELRFRQQLADKVEQDVFNPRIAAASTNAALKKALECQKNRNRILSSTCQIQTAVKRNKPFQVEENTLKRLKTIEFATSTCLNANTQLFIDVPRLIPAASSTTSAKESAAGMNHGPGFAFLLVTVLVLC